jgi:hypothetical protein
MVYGMHALDFDALRRRVLELEVFLTGDVAGK